MNWLQAKDSCIFNKKHLVVMETEREWEFVKNTLQGRRAVPYSEWHIGLYMNEITGKWTWINCKPLTIGKWQPYKPDKDSWYALMAKEWPPGSHGSFNSINRHVHRGWICEEETGMT